MKQFSEVMKQRYAFLRENPYILASWIQACPGREMRDIYIDYLHEETPHPEYLIGFAKEAGSTRRNFMEEGARDLHSVYGNVRIAFGENYSLGEKNKTHAREDLVLRRANL